MIVGLLHPGRMGSAIAERLTRAGHTVLWTPERRSPATAERAAAAKLQPSTLPELVSTAEIVLSICPAEAADEVAESVMKHRYTGIFVEANAIKPDRARAINDALADTATVIDAVISGAPPGGEGEPRIYLAGPPEAAATVDELLVSSRLDSRRLGDEIGAASAFKMMTASYMRAARAAAMETHALAAHYGVTDALIQEAHHLRAPMLADRDYIPSVAARAWRWAFEMNEISSTLKVANLPTGLADGAKAIFERLAAAKDKWNITPDEVFALLKDPPS
ncbi:DUF1932 domain-containing protein [Nocardia carnea]|uniref:DUF1932 domain-containing protein n=1 Tax=Nocardia carnea TaxID=37328 RepID=UPI00030FC0F3|nr:DUF1932 domain-containing protein [Nocardia carnea]